MAAQGQFARAIAEEGGMPSVLWAGARKKGPVRMTIGVTIEMLEYQISCGLPQPNAPPDFVEDDEGNFHSRAPSRDREPDPFVMDPRIKEENVSFISGKTRQTLLERGTATAMLRDSEGNRT